MKWILIVPAVIVSLAFLVAFIGMFLPADFHGQARAGFKQSPEKIWLILSDYKKLSIGGSMSKGVEILPNENGMHVWKEDVGGTQLLIRTKESLIARRLVLDVKDLVVPMKMRWNVEIISSSGSQCEVRVSQDGTIDSGNWRTPFFRFVMKALNGQSSAPKEYLSQLGRLLGSSAANYN
jgi:hypothetical protein